MAVVSMILGGMAGFFSAAVGLIALNFSWLAALGLWSGVGCAVAALILAMALLPRSPATTAPSFKRA